MCEGNVNINTAASWKDQFPSNLKTIKKLDNLRNMKIKRKIAAFKYSSLYASLRFQQTEDKHRKKRLQMFARYFNFYSFITLEVYYEG